MQLTAAHLRYLLAIYEVSRTHLDISSRSIAEKLGKQMVMEAGNAALKGHRIVVDKGKKTERTILYTSPRAYNRFRARLWEIYPKTES